MHGEGVSGEWGGGGGGGGGRRGHTLVPKCFGVKDKSLYMKFQGERVYATMGKTRKYICTSCFFRGFLQWRCHPVRYYSCCLAWKNRVMQKVRQWPDRWLNKKSETISCIFFSTRDVSDFLFSLSFQLSLPSCIRLNDISTCLTLCCVFALHLCSVTEYFIIIYLGFLDIPELCTTTNGIHCLAKYCFHQDKV